MGYQFDWSVLWQFRELIWTGFQLTMTLFFWGTLLSVAIGIALGIVGTLPNRILVAVVDIYVEVSRNTPLVVKMFFIYFAMGLGNMNAAIAALAMHQSAYMTEVVRAGVRTVPFGQMEAGLASGLSRLTVLWRIVLPQAFLIVIPPMTTQILEVLKNTSVAMIISIEELTFQAQQIEALTFRGFEAATAGTLVYLLVGLIVTGAAMALERATASRRGGLLSARPTTVDV